jgi:hypothetical protein
MCSRICLIFYDHTAHGGQNIPLLLQTLIQLWEYSYATAQQRTLIVSSTVPDSPARTAASTSPLDKHIPKDTELEPDMEKLSGVEKSRSRRESDLEANALARAHGHEACQYGSGIHLQPYRTTTGCICSSTAHFYHFLRVPRLCPLPGSVCTSARTQASYSARSYTV